ncbi:MAG: hypothetical protein L3J35_13565 [Bacteroidales bacterium]|nr:hypothetical protein [Bacteroidales bacterium]
MISGKNKNNILPELKKRNLLPDNTLVFYDETEYYLPFHKFDIFNPRLTIINNNIIIHDKVYNPDKIYDLQKRIKDFIIELGI